MFGGSAAPAPAPKPEATLAPVAAVPPAAVPPAAPASADGSPPRRQKARPVIYKSSALQRSAPSLVASAAPATISNSHAIKRASAKAEAVRDEFKLAKCGPDIDVGDGDGDDEATNAKKYERRLLMNRHSAAASRVRREAYTKALEAEVLEQEAMLAAATALLEKERQLVYKLLEQKGPPNEMDESDVESVDEQETQDGKHVSEETAEDENEGEGEGQGAGNSEDEMLQEDVPDRETMEREILDFRQLHAPPQATAFAVMESQTEDSLATALAAPAHPRQEALQLPNSEHLPIQHHLPPPLASPKLEDFPFSNLQVPIPPEHTAMAPDDKLLESFLFCGPGNAKHDPELGPLDFS